MITLLLLLPILGILLIIILDSISGEPNATDINYDINSFPIESSSQRITSNINNKKYNKLPSAMDVIGGNKSKDKSYKDTLIKKIALVVSLLTLLLSLIIWGEFDNSNNNYQFVQELNPLYYFKFNVGIDGISLYYVILTTLTIPICLLSSWNNIKEGTKYFLICFLLLETLLIAVFVVLDLLLFYIFFESVLPPLFIVIGIWGHGNNKIRASFLLFLYTLLGSLFMLLSILTMYFSIGSTDFQLLTLSDFSFSTQKLIWLGIFLALAIKTPLLPFHIWLYRAHAEAPLAGSILLAGVVLKMSSYGFIRVLINMLPESSYYFTPLIQTICVITIIYGSLSTLRQNDLKAYVAYSSVAHMGTVTLGIFSNNIQGIEGAILLSIAHGLVSPALFILSGGVLYDRYHTRLIKYYRGLSLTMPIFSIFFFLFTCANMAVPLSLNFIGEFMSLMGAFEKNAILTIFAASSIVLGACYSIWLYNRVTFGAFSNYLNVTQDITKREFMLLLPLLLLTILLGIYPNVILDSIHLSVSNILYTTL